MDLYYAYWNSLNNQRLLLEPQRPSPPKIMPVVYIKQRGNGRPMYEFDRLSGVNGKLFGDNFISYICREKYDMLGSWPDVTYDADNGVWLCGNDEQPDFLFYLSRQAVGARIDYFISSNEAAELRPIYKKYNFEFMVSLIDSTNRWCILF